MSDQNPTTGPLVLVVEDDPDHRDLLAWACATAGADPLPVGDATAADAVLAGPLGASICLFVLDHRLPGRDGLALCRDLRRDVRHVVTPVILVSAAAGATAADEALDAGADAYVTKPFAMADLRAHVGRLLASHAAAPVVAGVAGVADWAAQFARYAALAGAASGAHAAGLEYLRPPIEIEERRRA